MISAVLDANVLYSSSQRNLLLRIAQRKMFFPVWSDEIHEEWMYNLAKNRPDLQWEKLEHTRRNMESYFPNSNVHGYESMTPTLTLPDPNDRHVLAIAIHAEAEFIVTSDLGHFPNAVLLPHKIEAVSPDDFVLRLIRLAPLPVLEAVRKHRSDLTRPSKTVEEYLATLEKQGLTTTVAFLREHEAEI